MAVTTYKNTYATCASTNYAYTHVSNLEAMCVSNDPEQMTLSISKIAVLGTYVLYTYTYDPRSRKNLSDLFLHNAENRRIKQRKLKGVEDFKLSTNATHM